MSKKSQPLPEPIPQSTVVALQAWQDKYKISNANWENKLNEAVTVNPADSIFVKASFIDTRGTASGNIDLAVDTTISLMPVMRADLFKLLLRPMLLII